MNFYFKKNKAFYIPYLVFLLVLLPVVLFIPKSDTHLFLNSYHSGWADLFFKYITYLGDGMAPVILAIIFLFVSFRKTFVVGASGILAGLVAQSLKRLVFKNVVRPVKFFEGITDLHLVDGVDMHSSFSFPSGHSATIFALCVCLIFFTDKNTLKFILFCLAVVVAFSRVYISQHFLTDIYAGSVIGVLSVVVFRNIFSGIKESWIDKNIISAFKRN